MHVFAFRLAEKFDRSKAKIDFTIDPYYEVLILDLLQKCQIICFILKH